MTSYDIFKEIHIPNNSLLAMAEPLLAQLATRAHRHNPESSIQDIGLEYTNSFVKNAHVAIGILDKNLSFLTISPKFFKTLKKYFLEPNHLDIKNIEEIYGKNFFDVVTTCPNSIKNAIRACLKGKYQRSAVLMELPNKTTKWIRWEALPWYNFNKKPTGIMFFCEDITKEKNALIMNKKLLKSNEMLQDFSLILSHDLLQPLRQIANFFHLLNDHLDSTQKNDPFTDATLRAINYSMLQIQNLSEGIVLYCKDGDMTVQTEPVSLFSIIERVQNVCLTHKDFSFNIPLEKDVELLMNPTCLTQLLQNLIVNAIKHSPSKNIVITLSGSPGKKSGFYDFVLHNNSLCMEKKPRDVFDPFKSSRIDGAGLGLMICKKIVQAYKGKISFSSSSTEGTKVSFSLPLFHPQENLVKQPSSSNN